MISEIHWMNRIRGKFIYIVNQGIYGYGRGTSDKEDVSS